MATSRRYASGTQVPVSRSQDEIRDLLRGLGADQIGVMEGGGKGFVVFKIRETLYRIASPEITVRRGQDPAPEQRRLWRAIVLLVKARAVAIREGITTVEREFLSDAVMPDGSVLADHAPRLIEQAYKDNGPPRLLMLGAPQ
jgi:chromosome condensin MukBEF MukE localization factor